MVSVQRQLNRVSRRSGYGRKIPVGLFFDRQTPSDDVVNLVETALRTPPPVPPAPDATQQATHLAGQVHPLVQTLSDALQSPTPANPGAAAKVMAQGAVDQLLGGPSFNTGRFVIAFVIFAALVGGGIACEATHLTTSTGTLFGFAGAVFGIVTAFLGTEKGSN
jgi:hypothetical protein